MSTEHIPTDIYRQCVAISKNYYTMLRRRREQEEIILHGSSCNDGQPKAQGTGDPTARKAERLIAAKERNDWKIRAVEQAWSRMEDQTARDFVKKNMFENIPIRFISLPMSTRSMKRLRNKFIRFVAEELGEI